MERIIVIGVYLLFVVWSYIAVFRCKYWEAKAFNSYYGDEIPTIYQLFLEATFACWFPFLNWGVIIDSNQHIHDAKHFIKTGEIIYHYAEY